MLILRVLVALGPLLMALPGMGQPMGCDKTALMADLSCLEAYLQNEYPGNAIPGFPVPTLKPLIDSLQQALPEGPMPPHTYAWWVREAAFRTHDVHMFLMKAPPIEVPDTSKWRMPPVLFGLYGSLVQCTDSLAPAPMRAGDTILSINGIGADEIRYKLARYYPNDYAGSVALGVSLTNNRPQWLFFRVFGGQDTTEYVVRRGTASMVVRLASVRKERSRTAPCSPAGFAPVKDSTLRLLSLAIHPQQKIAYLRIDQAALRSSFIGANHSAGRLIRKHKPDALIVDLRGVLGGNMANAQVLPAVLSGDRVKLWVSYRSDSSLRERMESFEKNRKSNKRVYFHIKKNEDTLQYLYASFANETFHRRLILLCDGGTASAAACAASLLQFHFPCTIIGSETGGNALVCTIFETNPKAEVLRLPGSGSQVHIPSGVAWFRSGDHLRGRGVVPDIWVEPTALDAALGRDPALSRALQEAGYRP